MGGKKKRKKKASKSSTPAVKSGVDAKLIKEAAALLGHAGDAKAAREALAVAEEVSKALGK